MKLMTMHPIKLPIFIHIYKLYILIAWRYDLSNSYNACAHYDGIVSISNLLVLSTRSFSKLKNGASNLKIN